MAGGCGEGVERRLEPSPTEKNSQAASTVALTPYPYQKHPNKNGGRTDVNEDWQFSLFPPSFAKYLAAGRGRRLGLGYVLRHVARAATSGPTLRPPCARSAVC